MCISFPTADLHYVKVVYALMSFRYHIIGRQLCVPVAFAAKCGPPLFYIRCLLRRATFPYQCCNGANKFHASNQCSIVSLRGHFEPTVYLYTKGTFQTNSLSVNKDLQSLGIQIGHFKSTVYEFRYTKRTLQANCLQLYK